MANMQEPRNIVLARFVSKNNDIPNSKHSSTITTNKTTIMYLFKDPTPFFIHLRKILAEVSVFYHFFQSKNTYPFSFFSSSTIYLEPKIVHRITVKISVTNKACVCK